MKPIRPLLVFGTRPDAIKMIPLVFACREHPLLSPIVCASGQHREMLSSVLEHFGVQPDYNLDIMQPGQSLTDITTRVLQGMAPVLKKERPDVVLVHGDTSTALAAGLAAFYVQRPLGHVEAGLRTGNLYSPFPEEMNRTLLGNLCSLHFAPTERNRENLLRQSAPGEIFVTGNTAIDVLRYTVKADHRFSPEALQKIDFSHRVILLTAHRRENLEQGLPAIFAAVRRILNDCPDVEFVFPVHPNPAVARQAEAAFADTPRVHRVTPVDVFDMHNLIGRCYMVMTDSGGLQEEAPSLGRPVLVLRKETERMEAIEAGTALLAGTDEQSVYESAMRLLHDPAAYGRMAHAQNPFGDGHAAERIAGIIAQRFGEENKA